MTQPPLAHASEEYDVVAIGAGPFNLGLAALALPLVNDGELTLTVLEQRAEFKWHPGMLLPEATIQVPFMADLVTLADPTNPLSFLNYCKRIGRLHHFYIKEDFYPLRAEYSDYCAWAAEQLPVQWNSRVAAVRECSDGTYEVHYVRDETQHCIRARHIVSGIGTSPFVPAELAGALEAPHTLHSAEYAAQRDALLALPSVTIVGSGQSAAEIYLDLLENCAATGQQLTWLTRSPRFFPMEYTKLTLEMTSPDYARYLRQLPADTRETLGREQRSLYKGISGDTINAIYDALYRYSRTQQLPTTLRADVAVSWAPGAEPTDGTSGPHRLRLQHRTSGAEGVHACDGVVLATGYRAPLLPDFFAPLGDSINRTSKGQMDVAEDFSVNPAHNIFVQNAEEHVTSLLAPDLGMGPWRNSIILKAILGREVYPIERAFAFQSFGGAAL